MHIHTCGHVPSKAISHTWLSRHLFAEWSPSLKHPTLYQAETLASCWTRPVLPCCVDHRYPATLMPYNLEINTSMESPVWARAKSAGGTAEAGCTSVLASGCTLGPTVLEGPPRSPDAALTLCKVGRQALTLQKCCPTWPDPIKSYLAAWQWPVQQGEDTAT